MTKPVEQKSEQSVENPNAIYLKSCSGIRSRGYPPGHIWKAVTEAQWTSTENMGWMSKEDAIKRFGADNVVVTGSSTLCNSCSKIFDEQIASMK